MTPEPGALQLPGVDVAVGLDNVAGDTGFYLKLLERFYSSQRDAMQAMHADLTAGRWPELARRAHSLRGTAAAVGAQAVRLAASEIELAAQAMRVPQMDALAEALATVMAGLEAYFASHSAHADAPVADTALASVARARLFALLCDYSGDAIDFFEQSRASLALTLPPETLDLLAQRLNNYDFDGARDLLT